MLCISVIIGAVTIGIVVFISKRKHTPTNLKGKTVLIIGASSGIGEACAEAFFRAGCSLILCARRLKELEKVKQNLLAFTEKTDQRVEIRQLDITDGDMVKKKLSNTHVDILISNAGVSYRGSIKDTHIKVHRQLMDVNYFGQVETVNALLPSMLGQASAHIVFISSLQGKLSIPYRSAYSASKHALQAFADCLRAEVSGSGIKVTVISPAYVRTDLSLSALHADGSKHGVMDTNQQRGMPAMHVADRVLSAIENQESEVLLCQASYKAAVWLRNILPSLFFKLMKRRAMKKEETG